MTKLTTGTSYTSIASATQRGFGAVGDLPLLKELRAIQINMQLLDPFDSTFPAINNFSFPNLLPENVE